MGRVYIGTSGWQYSNWRGSFYPADLPYSQWLAFYSKYFDTVEVNSSFYRQTRSSTFLKWQKETPKNFTFAVKGNKFITHIKRLKDCQDPLKVFFENVSVLSGHHIILWQLPPSLKQDIERLSVFLELLPDTFRHALEFRHETWVDQTTWRTLRNFKVAAVFQDWREWPQIREITTKFVYLRFHGNKTLYTSNYSDKELEHWSVLITNWLKQDLDVYTYFNNDAAGFAVLNALTLKKLVSVVDNPRI